MMEANAAAMWIGEVESIDAKAWIAGAGLAEDAVIFAGPLKKGR